MAASTEADKKALRWFEVSDGGGMNVIAAESHSRAKIIYGTGITGNYDNFESLQYVRATVVKPALKHEPKEDGEFYPDDLELLKKGVYASGFTEKPCVGCGKHCDEGNPQYYDRDGDSFYCDGCRGTRHEKKGSQP